MAMGFVLVECFMEVGLWSLAIMVLDIGIAWYTNIPLQAGLPQWCYSFAAHVSWKVSLSVSPYSFRFLARLRN